MARSRIPIQDQGRSGVPRPDAPKAARIPQQPVTAKKRWVFAFRYWKQAKNFGLDVDGQPAWFVSFLERLQSLCCEKVDTVIAAIGSTDGAAVGLRFHTIDHSDDHVTMSREAFDWIDAAYLGDEETYPFYQFQVSKGLGRVMGFFDEEWTFQVVLLDPMHNLWLTKYADYKVRRAGLLKSEYVELRTVLDLALEHLDGGVGEVERCRGTLSKAAIHGALDSDRTRIVLALDANDAEALRAAIRGRPGLSVSKVVEAGLLQYLCDADATIAEVGRELDATIPDEELGDDGKQA